MIKKNSWGRTLKVSIRYNADMHFSTLFFDLDATLYPPSSGLWEQIRLRIFKYMQEVIGLPEEKIPEIREHYWKTYGTTLEGLRIHYQVKEEDYLNFVHDIPLNDYLDPNPELRELLLSLPQDLWIFTNADHRHAGNVLQVLGINDLFAGIVDLYALNFIVKPNREAYLAALQLAGETDPTRCVLFDDLLQNLLPAKELGFYTSLVGENHQTNAVDIQITSILDIKQKIPQLWSQS
jgi:putative hydrolase of the HAD superfamily